MKAYSKMEDRKDAVLKFMIKEMRPLRWTDIKEKFGFNDFVLQRVLSELEKNRAIRKVNRRYNVNILWDEIEKKYKTDLKILEAFEEKARNSRLTLTEAEAIDFRKKHSKEKLEDENNKLEQLISFIDMLNNSIGLDTVKVNFSIDLPKEKIEDIRKEIKAAIERAKNRKLTREEEEDEARMDEIFALIKERNISV